MFEVVHLDEQHRLEGSRKETHFPVVYALFSLGHTPQAVQERSRLPYEELLAKTV